LEKSGPNLATRVVKTEGQVVIRPSAQLHGCS
jgi:hypothetical protein